LCWIYSKGLPGKENEQATNNYTDEPHSHKIKRERSILVLISIRGKEAKSDKGWKNYPGTE
jgi:hypothetical protein